MGCFLFFHSWSEWSYEADGSCKLARVCEKCGDVSYGSEAHDWGDWTYVRPRECAAARHCHRCGESEHQAEAHDWSAWQKSSEHCWELRVCTRCAAEETNLKHEIGNWRRLSKNSCLRVKSCAKCGYFESRPLESDDHTWTEVKYVPLSVGHHRIVRKCEVCGFTAESVGAHTLSPARKQCLQCGHGGSVSDTDAVKESYEMTTARALEILELPAPATPAQITAAHRRKMTEYHPDKVNNLGVKLRVLAEREAKLINLAAQHLRAEQA